MSREVVMNIHNIGWGRGMGVGSGDGGAKDTLAVSLRKGGKKKGNNGGRAGRNRRKRMLMR